MRIRNLLITLTTCFIASRSLAQNDVGQYAKYRHFAIYAGVGPGFFFNNVVVFKDDVNPWGYQFSFRFMWEPKNSFLSLGIETGYYRIYSASSDVKTALSPQPIPVKVTNSIVPFLFIVSMKFSKEFYASWSMGQSIKYNIIDAPNNPIRFKQSHRFACRFCSYGRLSVQTKRKDFLCSGIQRILLIQICKRNDCPALYRRV